MTAHRKLPVSLEDSCDLTLPPVFACHDRLLGNVKVAVELFARNANLDSPSISESIAAEARAANLVVHDHVVRFYELIERPHYVGIAMECADGQDLRDSAAREASGR